MLSRGIRRSLSPLGRAYLDSPIVISMYWRLASCFCVINDELRACDLRGAGIGSGKRWTSRLLLFVDAPSLVGGLTIWAPLPHQDFSFHQCGKVTCATCSRGSYNGLVSMLPTRNAHSPRRDKTARWTWEAYTYTFLFTIRTHLAYIHAPTCVYAFSLRRSSPSSNTYSTTQ